MIASKVIKALQEKRGTPEKKKILAGFFKCGAGEYGEGDKFLGVPVPEQRKIAKRFFCEASFEDVKTLLSSAYHEERLTGLFLLVYRFEKANERERVRIFRLYVRHTDRINNWDLVDVTCPNIVGEFLLNHPREVKIVRRWAYSKNMWERRMAVLATFAYIRKGDFQFTLDIAEILLSDKQDLICKAVGWMLREVGKRDKSVLERFLNAHSSRLSRITLRYAIERFSKEEREQYLLQKKGLSENRERFWKYFEGRISVSKERCIELLQSGKLGVLPTDTLYGLVCRAEERQSVERLYRTRERSGKKACIILLSRPEDMERFGVVFDDRNRRVARAVWPGSVSVLFPCPLKRWAYLHRGTKTLAFRVPDDANLREFLARTGPLIAPSANKEGFPVAETIAQARKTFGNEIDVWVDAGRLRGSASTLIALENDGIVLKREGKVSLESIERKMRSDGL